MMNSPNIAGRKFEFTPGLSVIFGENGAMKSSLLKTMAAYSGIEKGGWQTINDPAKLAANSLSHFPHVYRRFAPGNTDAIIVKDSSPVFYNDSDSVKKNDTSFFYSSANQSDDGLTTEAEQMSILMAKPSSGQFRIHKINTIMEALKTPPNLTVVPSHIIDKQKALLEVEYLSKLPNQNRMTVLLDEPEKALFLPKQLELFNSLKELAKYFQVIIVTHSPFILFLDDINLIDLVPGSSKVCRDLIKKQVNKKK